MGVYEDWQKLASMVRGFMPSRVILSAQRLGVFNALTRPLTAKGLAKKLSLDQRATEILLDALTGLGLLKKRHNTYRLSALAKRFLIPESPYYMGNAIEHMDNLWHSWTHLTETLKTGVPSPRESFDHEIFIRAMDDLAKWKVKDVLQRIDLSTVKTALDLGGGPGTYARALARKGIRVTLFDRKESISVAKELIEREGLSDSITLVSGDFLNDPIGRDYDMVLVSQVLHAYGPRDCIKVLKKIRKALNLNGMVVIHEFFVRKNRSGPPSGVLFGVNMLVNTPEGRVYPIHEIKEMLRKASFRGTDIHHLQDTVVVVARR